MEKQVQQYQDQFKVKDQECKELKKSQALKDQKIEFLEIQINDLRQQLDDKDKQHQQMFMALNGGFSNDFEKSGSSQINNEKIESYQQEIKRLQNSHGIEVDNLISKVEFYQNKFNELELQTKLLKSDHEQELAQYQIFVQELESQKISFVEKFKHSENQRHLSQEQQETKFRKMVKLYENQLEERNNQSQQDIKDLQEQSEKEIMSLRNFYEMEKEKLELRLNEEKDKNQHRISILTEEFEQKLRDELQDREEEIECLQTELRESEQIHQGFAQQIEYELGLKQQMIENLDKQLRETKEKIELLENGKYSAFQKQIESFEQQRSEYNSKIERLQKELNEKDKNNALIQNQLDHANEELQKKNNEYEDLKQQYEDYKKQTQEKIDNLKKRISDFQDENLKYKVQIERERAQYRQQVKQKEEEIKSIQIARQTVQNQLADLQTEKNNLDRILNEKAIELRCCTCLCLYELNQFKDHIQNDRCKPAISKEQLQELKLKNRENYQGKNKDDISIYLNKFELVQDQQNEKISFKMSLSVSDKSGIQFELNMTRTLLQLIGLITYLVKREKENEIGKTAFKIQEQLMKNTGPTIKSDKNTQNILRISLQHFFNEILRNQQLMATNDHVKSFFEDIKIYKNLNNEREKQSQFKDIVIVECFDEANNAQSQKQSRMGKSLNSFRNSVNSTSGNTEETGKIDYRELQRQLGIETSTVSQRDSKLIKQDNGSKYPNYVELGSMKSKGQILSIASDHEEEEEVIEFVMPNTKQNQNDSSRKSSEHSRKSNGKYKEIPIDPLQYFEEDEGSQIKVEQITLNRASIKKRTNSEVPSANDIDDQSEEIKESFEETQRGELLRYEVFIIANPRSGSRKGAQLLKNYGGKLLQMVFNEKNANVQVFDVITQNQTNQSQLIVAVLGGDGSLGCFIDSIIQEQIIADNLSKIHFTGLPFGTGNDTGRAFGWGGDEGKLAKSLEYMVENLILGKRENLALWEVEFKSAETHGYSGSARIKISKEDEHYKKIMCCYFNVGLDAVISNDYEGRRTKSKALNKAKFTWLAIKHLLCSCSAFSVNNFLDSIHEIKEQKSHKLLDMSQIPVNPKMMLGTNLPSFYGGMQSEAWFKNKKNKGFSSEIIDDSRLGQQSYSDNKIELMGQHSIGRLFTLKEMRRYCQIEGPFEFHFRKDIPQQAPIFISIDGENYVMFGAEKLVFRQYHLAPYITIIRGPKKPFRT
ncbi:guanylate-binding n-terminal domain containing protein [Stylonychia lemnae]|uniref:diacylglycerol kinase (ATP) n=1 Tax=Stylonychia lemnae TaxID=5949 RepID=A0A078AP90_STYLE|nr:guanylate-binding n-terminal domain containing protein [Stylonychia lemnae]|eukprot:CDW82778.1 guanylate-binding n-terminal domain containing protein [Stylonychia lemnae]